MRGKRTIKLPVADGYRVGPRLRVIDVILREQRDAAQAVADAHVNLRRKVARGDVFVVAHAPPADGIARVVVHGRVVSHEVKTPEEVVAVRRLHRAPLLKRRRRPTRICWLRDASGRVWGLLGSQLRAQRAA
jgi:hypothetical protein